MRNFLLSIAVPFALFAWASCGESEQDTTGAAVDPRAQSLVPASIFVASAPSGAIGVREALSKAKAGEDIVVRGVIGGRKKPFVEGRAVMIAADPELAPCTVDDGCATPWDYCCETQETLLANTLTVQIVDDKGAPLAASLDGVYGLGTLKTIVVSGRVRSTDGSLVIDAKTIHVAGD